MRRLLLGLALVCLTPVGALAQDSELSGGGAGGGSGTVTVAGGSGTAGTVPKFDSATVLSDSAITQSGANVGIGGASSYPLTVYGDTDGNAKGPLYVQAVNGNTIGTALTLDAVPQGGKIWSFISRGATGGPGTFGFYNGTDSVYRALLTASGWQVGSAGQYAFASGAGAEGAPDTGLSRSAAGIVKVTNGAGGDGALVSTAVTSPLGNLKLNAPAGSALSVGVNGAADVWFFDSLGALWPAFAGSNIGDTPAGRQINNLYLNNSVQGCNTKILTEGAATGFVDISCAAATAVGGVVEYTVTTTNGTDFSVESGEIFFTGVNKDGGTLDDVDVGLIGTPVQSTSAANVFTNTFTVTAGTGKLTLNCNTATTLAGTDVITIRYRVRINSGTATVTAL